MPDNTQFEERIKQSLMSSNSEKTFIDKSLARDDVKAIQELVKKSHLNREDLLELLYLLSSTESKLYNLGEWERYIILKLFVWIREFVKTAEQLYDYQDDLKKKEAQLGKDGKARVLLTETTKQLIYNNERLIEHNIKFLIDLYLNICRTTLSLGATGFLEILKSKFEFSYPTAQIGGAGEQKKGFFSKLMGG